MLFSINFLYLQNHEYYHRYHHMWYTLPWSFDEFFHQYIPYNWITEVHLFHLPSRSTTTTPFKKSSLRTLDASGQTLASCIMALPHVVLDDCIETLHVSFYNRPIYVNLPHLRNLTLVNSINCLSCCSRFLPTIRSVRIISFHRLPNYMLPNWPLVLHSLSTMPQLTSLRIFMYDLLKTVDDHSCQMIAKAVSSLTDFSFCFRYEYCSPEDDQFLPMAFKDHAKCIKELCRCILLFTGDRNSHHVIEDDGCGVTVWS